MAVLNCSRARSFSPVPTVARRILTEKSHRSLSGRKGMVGEPEDDVGCCLGCKRQHLWIVIRKVIAPEVRPVHAAAIEAGYVTFVVAKIPTPESYLRWPLATVLSRQNAGIGDANQSERIGVGAK